MKAGSLVLYVDGQNAAQLGILTADATPQSSATIVPLSAILALGQLVLGPISVPLAQSQILAGGPPYWMSGEAGLDATLTGAAVAIQSG